MSEGLKDSGTVTALSVIGLVFGLIGMLGSFIPCIGSIAFYVGIPAAIISAIALGVAYSQKAKQTFAIVALTISLIGVVISGWQYFSIVTAGKNAQQQLEHMSKQR
jgi:dolichyl-phosphate-mannose--protein O-mannosyl transferase